MWLINICGTYIAFSFIILFLILDRIIYHEKIVHKSRLEDISVVDATFVEVQAVQKPEHMTDEEYLEKQRIVNSEVDRLRKIGNKGWTEYQVLSLNQFLVEFLGKHELIARAQSYLEELEDYAEDKAYGGYDRKQYDIWEERINDAIEVCEKEEDTKQPTTDDSSQKGIPSQEYEPVYKLQVRLQTLLEHIASYNHNWSEGSAVINGIKLCGMLIIFILIPMGLVPILHCQGEQSLKFFNWGLFGIVGAISAVLLELRKSDYVEVGNTQGKKELWRTFVGSSLGFLSGIIAYWMFAAGLFIEGAAVPKLGSELLRDNGLSFIWAIASGFCFEKIFNRMVSSTIGTSE